MKLTNFAIDFGNGYVKAKSEKGEFVYSSKIGHSSSLGTSSLSFSDGLSINRYQRKDEGEYVFGKDLERAIDPEELISTNSSNNRYTLDSFKRLVDFSLAELASYEEEKNINVRLVTGMPSVEMSMQKKKDTFERYLKGTHVVYRNGIEHVINVKELKLIEQPLGTLLNVYLNEQLKVHKTFKNGLVVVIDFGSGTTIIDIYRNMRRIDGRTLNTGMIEFHGKIAELLSSDLSVNINPQYIENGIKNKTYIAKVGNQSLSFKEYFDQELMKKIESIVQIYESLIGEEALVNDFVITGGGALIIGDQLKEIKPNFKIVENPQISTARGYFKLAKTLVKGG